MNNKNINNMKINRITFLVVGIAFAFFGFFMPAFLLIAALLLFLSYKTNRAYKEAITVSKPEVEAIINKSVKVENVIDSSNLPTKETASQSTVKVTDLDGSVRDVQIYCSISDKDSVLVADGGKTYHTYLDCFKKWKPEMVDNFTGWKIIKKSDAISLGMTHCSFCEDVDKAKEMSKKIHTEYKALLKKYADSDIDDKVNILSECYRKIELIETKYGGYDGIDIYSEYEKIEKKARSFINAYIKDERDSCSDDFMIDIMQFSDDLYFIADYIYEKDDKLNKM